MSRSPPGKFIKLHGRLIDAEEDESRIERRLPPDHDAQIARVEFRLPQGIEIEAVQQPDDRDRRGGDDGGRREAPAAGKHGIDVAVSPVPTPAQERRAFASSVISSGAMTRRRATADEKPRPSDPFTTGSFDFPARAEIRPSVTLRYDSRPGPRRALNDKFCIAAAASFHSGARARRGRQAASPPQGIREQFRRSAGADFQQPHRPNRPDEERIARAADPLTGEEAAADSDLGEQWMFKPNAPLHHGPRMRTSPLFYTTNAALASVGAAIGPLPRGRYRLRLCTAAGS